jgi:hypothetical protein
MATKKGMAVRETILAAGVSSDRAPTGVLVDVARQDKALSLFFVTALADFNRYFKLTKDGKSQVQALILK